MIQSTAESLSVPIVTLLYSYIIGYAAITNNSPLFQGPRLWKASVPCYDHCQDKGERGERRRADNPVPLANSQISPSAHSPLAKANSMTSTASAYGEHQSYEMPRKQCQEHLVNSTNHQHNGQMQAKHCGSCCRHPCYRHRSIVFQFKNIYHQNYSSKSFIFNFLFSSPKRLLQNYFVENVWEKRSHTKKTLLNYFF